MDPITTLINDELDMQLDSVSWNKKHDILAIGAYMIDPQDSTQRVGKIFLIQLQLSNNGNGNGKRVEENANLYKVVQEVSLSGVLDLKWEPEEENLLAVATSSSLEVHCLDATEDPKNIKLLYRLELTSMALYTQWMSIDKLVFSDSEGIIQLVSVTPKSLDITASKKVHDNLTWVVQYSSKLNLLFAGSDEGKFTGFLLENIEDEEKHFTKKFEVGVTSILFVSDNILAVGSYDDTLRLFSIDNVDPIFLSLKKKIEFGGAVWRTMSFPVERDAESVTKDKKFNIIASCARNGVHVIELNSNSWTYDTIATCMKHEGFLAYGLDATLKEQEGKKVYNIASCFFDNQYFHFWQLQVSSD